MVTATVLGGTTGLGKATIDALISQNINTKALVNDIEYFKRMYPDKLPGKVTLYPGDMDNNEAISAACEDTDIIYFCVDLPYQDWKRKMNVYITKTVYVAEALEARIVYPGNMYTYGKIDAAQLPLTEEAPQTPNTEYGQLSVAIENRLMKAAMDGAELTIIRLPFIYGPAILDPLMQAVFLSAIRGSATSWYGDPDLPQQFIYVEQVGKILAEAGLNAETADTIIHAGAIEPITPREWLEKIYELAGSECRITQPSTWMLYLKSVFNRDVLQFIDLKSRFDQSMILDDEKYNLLMDQDYLGTATDGIEDTINWFRYWFEI